MTTWHHVALLWSLRQTQPTRGKPARLLNPDTETFMEMAIEYTCDILLDEVVLALEDWCGIRVDGSTVRRVLLCGSHLTYT